MKYTHLINQWTCRFAVAGLTLMTLPVLAEEAQNLENSQAIGAPTEGPTADKTPPVSVSSGLAEQFNTGITKGGTMSITRFNAGVLAPVRVSDALVLSTSFRFGLDSYDFRSVPGGSPWHNIDTYTLASILQGKIDDQWSVYGGGIVRESGETGAEFKKGITGGGIAGVNYKYSDTLTFGGGLGVMSQLEDHAQVLPLITVNWKFADAWHLKVGLSDVATIGYGAQVTYDLSKDWQLSAGLQHEKSRFRIEGAGVSSGGIGQEQATTLFFDATWHATETLSLDGYAGLATGGNLRVENSKGTEIGSSDYNTAAVLGVKASLRF